MIIRQPAVAGSFYPANTAELDKEITTLINQSKKIGTTGKIKVLIVPHAGIIFSGPTAAAGFKQIENKNYKKIILLGASHQAWFDYAAIFDKGIWETPLGKIEINNNLAKTIINQEQNIITGYSPHMTEHSLEVELIFLQKVLKNFKILPILISQTSDELIDNLAKKISQNFDDQTLLVISTDLSHYPSYEIANEVDGKTISAILSGSPEKFNQTIAAVESAGYPGLETAACGHEALRVALRVNQISKLKFKKIKYQNSGDLVFGEKSQVVGYASIIGISKN